MTPQTAGTVPARQGRTEAPSALGITIVALLCLVPAVYCYARLIYAGRPGMFPPVPHGLTFNSMLSHLLAGRFDVDPPVIGTEGFLRGGRVYAYFGILPALLRLPLFWLPRFATLDLTAPSCLVAVGLMALFKQLSLLAVWRSTGMRQGAWLVALVTIAILFSGAQVQFLKASLYQEVCLWADVFAAAFVWLVLRAYYSASGFTAAALSGMAAVAGLCLLTRVSTGLGLYLAFGLLWLHLAWRKFHGSAAGRLRFADFLPLAIVLGFAAAAGVVNEQRFANPFVFMDPQYHIMTVRYAPDRLVRAREYGDFNLRRLGFGLVYYFFPVWVLHGPDGQLLWTAFQQRTIDAAELPPSSFFLSDPLLVGLTAYAWVHLARYRDIARPGSVIAVAAGLAVPMLLMLTAIYMAFRYRFEFYPFLEFCALIGLGRLLSPQARPLGALGRTAIAAAVAIGCLAALSLFFLYKLSPFGPATILIGKTSLYSYYRSELLHH